jgi:lipoprotein-anchoring transpeptidase ErfK/SrfK
MLGFGCPLAIYRGMARQLILILATIAASGVAARGQESRRVVISIPDRKLSLYEGGEVLKSWDIAVGKPSTPSPHGEATIVSRVKNPTWYGPGGKVVGPGRSNPVGTRWIGLSIKGFGIHGTNEPDSIGNAASHGCIRMRNRDVEELFAMVDTGTPVALE